MPGRRGRPGPLRAHGDLALSGPNRCVPDGIDTRRGYMATELDHSFSTTKSMDDSFAAITDLERVVPCVEGGRVLGRPDLSRSGPRSS